MARSTPTTTSALLVRKLKIGKDPARPLRASENDVQAGHLRSPVSLKTGQNTIG